MRQRVAVQPLYHIQLGYCTMVKYQCRIVQDYRYLLAALEMKSIP